MHSKVAARMRKPRRYWTFVVMVDDSEPKPFTVHFQALTFQEAAKRARGWFGGARIVFACNGYKVNLASEWRQSMDLATVTA